VNKINSRVDTSAGSVFMNLSEKPNIIFIQERKKKVGPRRYKNINKNSVHKGNKSKKKEKKSISETKKIDPGNPRNIKTLSKTSKKSFGHK
jgi:hypothetical protein